MRAGDSLEERAARLRKECRHAEIPTTVVAIEGQRCTVSSYDLGGRVVIEK